MLALPIRDIFLITFYGLQVAGFDSLCVLEMKERNFVCRANRLLLAKCYDNKKVKSPYNQVISPLTQPRVANQQKNGNNKTLFLFLLLILILKMFLFNFLSFLIMVANVYFDQPMLLGKAFASLKYFVTVFPSFHTFQHQIVEKGSSYVPSNRAQNQGIYN